MFGAADASVDRSGSPKPGRQSPLLDAITPGLTKPAQPRSPLSTRMFGSASFSPNSRDSPASVSSEPDINPADVLSTHALGSLPLPTQPLGKTLRLIIQQCGALLWRFVSVATVSSDQSPSVQLKDVPAVVSSLHYLLHFSIDSVQRAALSSLACLLSNPATKGSACICLRSDLRC